MARGERVQVAFNAGEWSPLLDGRSDLEKAAMACRKLTNMRVGVDGVASRRAGTKHVATVRDAEFLGIFATVGGVETRYFFGGAGQTSFAFGSHLFAGNEFDVVVPFRLHNYSSSAMTLTVEMGAGAFGWGTATGPYSYASNPTTGISLPAGGDYVFWINFNITTCASVTATLTITSDTGLVRTVALSACGTYIPLLAETTEVETQAWKASLTGASGTLTTRSERIANDLMVQLNAASYRAKIKYLLPLLGDNLASAITPLIDDLTAGRPTNSGFVDGDFVEANGLRGDGTGKVVDTKVTPQSLGTSGNGGIYWAETGYAQTGTSINIPVGTLMGNNNATGCYLRLNTSSEACVWGAFTSTPAESNEASGNKRYYAQRGSATNRRIFVNGTKKATNTTSDDASDISSAHSILMMGRYADTAYPPGQITYWAGRCGCCALTDGSLTDGEASDLDQILNDHLLVPKASCGGA